MIKYEINEREVKVLDMDYEVGEGAFVIEAQYMDNGEFLDAEELKKLEVIYQSELCAEAYSNLIDEAHYKWAD